MSLSVGIRMSIRIVHQHTRETGREERQKAIDDSDEYGIQVEVFGNASQHAAEHFVGA